MNPVPFILLAISLPLLLGGCGGKDESTTETKPVGEKVLEVTNEVKPEEPVAETKPELEGVNRDELERRKDIVYLKGSDTPYTGKSFELYKDGQKRYEVNYKDGKKDGLETNWHQNGQKTIEKNWKDGKPDGVWAIWHKNGEKQEEVNWKDGKIISRKYWNSKGEPVDSGG
mgnify:CR=1 FL=1